ncbi:MAG: lysozyme inhibitor LprI family protein [Pseudomonadota bacterium]
MLIRLMACSLLLLWGASAMAQTQSQLNRDACAEYQKADQELNATYQKILQQHKDDAVFIRKMKKAQRAWLAFRDAELAAIYPAANKQIEYGSIYPMCHCTEQTALVNQRIKQLSAWLTAEEGDTCRGSR